MGKKRKLTKNGAQSGRKPVPIEEKAVLVGFYTKQKLITQEGGLQAARERAKNLFENYAMSWPSASPHRPRNDWIYENSR